MSKVVEVSHLTKSFGRVVAVNQVSFSIEAGKIYGLLGRNGAGQHSPSSARRPWSTPLRRARKCLRVRRWAACFRPPSWAMGM